MHRIRYRIKTLAPVVIASKAGDMNMITTERYIPGTSVIGILASRVITKNNLSDAHKDTDFYNWFLAGKLKIGNAYIFTKDTKGKEFTHVPVLFSIQKEKNDDKKIYNLLYVDDDDEELKDVQTKSIENVFCVPHLLYEDDTLQIKAVETSLNFHHARDPKTGVSKKGIIFNYESLSPNQIFEGEITGEQAGLQELINLCDDEKPCYVGRSKNAQYGKIRFEFVDKEPTQCSFPEIETDEGKISLIFLSDTIIYNNSGFSTADTKELEKYLGVEIEKAFVKKGQVETFVNKWQLRKPSETCFLAGSTFLLKGISKDHLAGFAELQQSGIGERTHEGFGRCVFGWKTDKQLYEPKEDSVKLEKPKHPIPAMTQKILETIVRDSVKKQAELKGLDKQNGFNKPPSNALIGRLSAILKGSITRDKFKESLEKLKKPARSQLEHCNNGSKTLWDFLMDRNTQSILNKSSSANLKDICKEIEYNPEEDEKLSNLYQIYLETFFSMMRKRSKEKGD